MSDELIEALRRDVERTKAHDILKLRSDVNHLVQPLIGHLRMVEAGRTDVGDLAHYIDRLRLVLALMDEAANGEHADEAHRARHGVGQNHYPTLAALDGASDATR